MNTTPPIPRPRNYRRTALLVTVIALVIVFILWNVPALDFLVYPLRLFVTFIHEAGHSLAAIITGGEVRQFIVSPDGSGLAVTAGGNRSIVIASGYLGAALFGSALFFSANRFPRLAQGLSVLLGIGMALFTVMFAAPDEQTGLPVALMVGVGFGAILALIGIRLNTLINLLVLNVLAVMTALNAVLDVVLLSRFIDATRGMVSNDAVAFSREVAPAIPASLVAMIWALLALIMLGLAVYFGLWKPFTAEINDTYRKLRED